MFEIKETTTSEANRTTFLGSGRETCQQAIQDFLGECLSPMLQKHVVHFALYSEYRISILYTDIITIVYDIVYRIENFQDTLRACP